MPGVARATMLVTPKPHSGSAVIVRERDRLRDEARLVEQLPEAIGESGEMVARQRGPYARIDADKQHLDTRLDPVAQRREDRQQLELWALSIGHWAFL